MLTGPKRPERRPLLAFLVGTLAGILSCGATALELDVLETKDLRLLYLHPFQTYLVPHVGRTFQNSLAIQERVFDWKPYDKTNVVLIDISDYGNAGASASPFNGVSVFIAPPVHTLESLPGSERMYSTMNHEMVHVANWDAANEQDLRWRKFIGGKPRHTDEHPETILYNPTRPASITRGILPGHKGWEDVLRTQFRLCDAGGAPARKAAGMRVTFQ